MTGSPAVRPTKTGYGSRNTMPLTVSMSRTCIQPGQEMRVVAKTVRGAQVGFAAAYSNNEFVPDIFWVRGEANPTGTAIWTWVLRPTTPRGKAVLQVVAAKSPNGATFEGAFTVADAC